MALHKLRNTRIATRNGADGSCVIKELDALEQAALVREAGNLEKIKITNFNLVASNVMFIVYDKKGTPMIQGYTTDTQIRVITNTYREAGYKISFYEPEKYVQIVKDNRDALSFVASVCENGNSVLPIFICDNSIRESECFMHFDKDGVSALGVYRELSNKYPSGDGQGVYLTATGGRSIATSAREYDDYRYIPFTVNGTKFWFNSTHVGHNGRLATDMAVYPLFVAKGVNMYVGDVDAETDPVIASVVNAVKSTGKADLSDNPLLRAADISAADGEVD